ncbi:cobalt/nickel transport protein [Nocardiopsis mwathae]|uniref:Cobalt transport protein CbiN n=1 Tax=Nocardiopsis mwathae TaxID=1472723 RepID=A0A7W9YFZ5_9ACTN|nr:energy-coupling factor ABC transporter substrate-binding protein [Nocardiopsis mwathae]MBB6170806.1 cobalt/nickel transport protein [Nocardiopsis mwathae]
MTPAQPQQPRPDQGTDPRRDGGPRPRAWITWAMVAVIAVIAALPLVTGAGDHLDEPFPGADEQGEEAVEEIAPAYEPWLDPLFEAPSAEVESGIFAVQAAIGAGIIGYYFGVVHTRSRMRREQAPAPSAAASAAGTTGAPRDPDATDASPHGDAPDGTAPARD